MALVRNHRPPLITSTILVDSGLQHPIEAPDNDDELDNDPYGDDCLGVGLGEEDEEEDAR